MASSKAALQAVNAQGRLMGFGSMFRKENQEWWRTRQWLIHSIIWLLLVNGIVLAVLKAPPNPNVPPQNRTTGELIFVTMSGLMTGLGIIIVMQGSILDEKKSGKAAWVLSKPLSRPAFIFAKLLANALAGLLIMVVLQGIVAYLLMNAFEKNPPGLIPVANGLVLLFLHLLFYLILTLMLGTLFKERGPVIGIPIGLLFGAQLIVGFAPGIAPYTPWPIVMPIGGTDALAVILMHGQRLPTLTPIIFTVIWIVVFIGIALWRFEREEF